MKRKIRIIVSSIACAVLIGWLVLWALSDNTSIQVSKYTIQCENLPEAFSGFRIAQISDFHNTIFPNQNAQLLWLLRNNRPDIIVFTGDLIDSRKPDLDAALAFVTKATEIGECYYVRGNHEASTPLFRDLEKRLKDIGVVILTDDLFVLHRNGAEISLLGLDDPTLSSNYIKLGSEEVVHRAMQKLTNGVNTFNILLAHHPEWLDIYSEYPVDLVLSGHAHGGQIRFNHKGLIAPNQGLFPKYDSGLYTKNNTKMVVSRGLGNSLFPYRINNQPELVIIELRS